MKNRAILKKILFILTLMATVCFSERRADALEINAFTANNGVVVFRPAAGSKPLPNGGGAAAQAKNAEEEKPWDADFRTLADELIEHINQERRAVGAPELRTDENLMKAASLRASEVTEKFDHARPDGKEFHTVLSEFGLNPLSSAENIARRSDDSALKVNQQFMNSPGHKKNMLNPAYSRVGVGVGVNRDDKKHYWVELFAGEEISR
jgi:uncharacterized protein YkwD